MQPAPASFRTSERPHPKDARALAGALAEAIEGEVRFSDGDRALYAYDASIYRQIPIGIVVPKHAGDVEAALAICREHEVPILGRGCGTSLSGQCCNAAVVFDFSKYMAGILELDPHRREARVLPGTICDTLRFGAKPYGLTFAPDPATHDHCTLGGMIGNNSCGTHSVMGGKTVDNTERLEILTYDGLRLSVGATDEKELEQIVREGGRRGEIYAKLKSLADRYGALIRRHFPKIPRRVSGYNLDSLLPEMGFDVAKALVGTESTCVLVLEATLRLVENPPKRTLVVLGFPDIPSSGDIVPEIMKHRPVGTEFFSQHVIENIEKKRMRFARSEKLLPEGQAFVLAEFGGATQEEADERARALEAELKARPGGPAIRFYSNADDETAVWEIRKHSAGTSRMPIGLGHHGGWPNWEDAAVAPERLGDFLRGQLAILTKYGYDSVMFGHWGQGCIHQRIDFDFRTAEGVKRFRAFMEESADLVVRLGGSISGEHGDGQGRAELVPKMYPPELIGAFREFKAIWDPHGRMNPGKMVDPYRMDQNLREGSDYRFVNLESIFAFPQDGGSFAEAANRCFGVGKCRHYENGTMCPSFMATREEKHSTRGRSRLLQEMMRVGGPIASGWRNEPVKEALDLCLACKGCKGDCPVQVDMATYKAEFLHHYYKGRPRPLTAYAMGLIMMWARLASVRPNLANALLHAPVLSDVMKRTVGIAPQREIPRFAPRTFKDWFFGRERKNPHGAAVILWPDTFNNYFTPEVAIAATEVLEAAGYRVEVPQQTLCCGRPLYDYGMLLTAKAFLRDILEALRPRIQAGVHIVGLEPSCVSVFRDELVNLLPHDLDAQRLAHQTRTLSEFLMEIGERWQPPKVHRKALVQPHCHHKAVMGFDSERALLEKMGVEAEIPDSGCCGMAGSFGYEAGERYEVSMACAERVLLPKVREAREETVILADGFSCREQIEQGTGVRPLHLAEMIRDAMSPTRLSELHKRSVNGKAPTALGAAEVALLGAGLAAFGGAIALQRLNSNGGNR
jgi:FAD/FMN-containing dehydrogenase/Fe-S oxidoreductase